MMVRNKLGIGSEYRPLLLAWLSFSILFAIFWMIYAPFFPIDGLRMGHDYSFMFPAWFDGQIWFQKNGLQVPWFSPSFCAGQPFFSDPQSTFYSLPQFIALLASPIHTALITLLMSASFMFWGGYLLMRRVFLVAPLTAILVGGLLMFNGFLPHRILVGHVTFHGFAFVPWIALLLLLNIRSRLHQVMAACVVGVILAYWAHSGLGSLLLACILSVCVVAFMFGLTGQSLTQFFARGMLAIVIGIGLAIAKLWAAFSFLSNFPRTSYLMPGVGSVLDTFVVIAEVLFVPSEWAYALGVSKMKNVQWSVSPHEMAYNFGTFSALLLLVLIVLHIKNARQLFETSRQKFLWLLLMLSLAWPFAFNVWDPSWNAILKSIPVINSTSLPLRWVIVYIIPIAIAIGLWLDRAQLGRMGRFLAVACLLGTVLQSVFESRGYYQSQNYDIRPISIADAMNKSGKFVPGIRVLGTSADVQVGEQYLRLGLNDTFIVGMSQVFCYNPVFGYRLEKFSAANLTSGSVLMERDGYLNLKNPACYAYPNENNCKPGDRFRVDQLEQAKAFIDYRPFTFNISVGQKWANTVTQGTMVFIVCLLLVFITISMRTVLRRNK